MGRGKGRSKGIDVTKHFLQPTGPSDRISVLVSPAQVIQVGEDDLSPTQGSEATFASKREGKAELQMKLCANWRDGACHSYAACGNAHVAAFFNTPALPSVSHAPALSGGAEAPLKREDAPNPPNPPQQTPQQTEPHLPGEHRTPRGASRSPSLHHTLIPAPRSQQHRQAAASWSRKLLGPAPPAPNRAVGATNGPSRAPKAPIGPRPREAESESEEDAWVNPMPMPTGAAIWGEAGAHAVWDLSEDAPNEAAERTPHRGDAWGSLGVHSGGHGHSNAAQAESLRLQLLRELVGAGAEGMEGGIAHAEPILGDSRYSEGGNSNLNSHMNAEERDDSHGKNHQNGGGGSATDLLGLLGASSGERGSALNSPTITPSRSEKTIRHLMTLLTTE